MYISRKYHVVEVPRPVARQAKQSWLINASVQSSVQRGVCTLSVRELLTIVNFVHMLLCESFSGYRVLVCYCCHAVIVMMLPFQRRRA